MTGGVKMEWLVGSDKALGELPKATARNTLKRILTKAAQPVAEAMRAGAPRLTGYTAGSIGVSSTANPAQSRVVKKEGKAFAAVYVGSTRGSAAVFEEFGTIKQRAHPYLRPAWDMTQYEVLEIIKKNLWVEIEKSAARLAKKRGKALL